MERILAMIPITSVEFIIVWKSLMICYTLHVIIIPGGGLDIFDRGGWIYTFRGVAQGHEIGWSGMGDAGRHIGIGRNTTLKRT